MEQVFSNFLENWNTLAGGYGKGGKEGRPVLNTAS